MVKELCGAPDPGGPGAYCTKDKGHYGYHADGGYIFGPERKRPAKPKVNKLAALEKRVAKLEEDLKMVARAAYKADMRTKKY